MADTTDDQVTEVRSSLRLDVGGDDALSSDDDARRVGDEARQPAHRTPMSDASPTRRNVFIANLSDAQVCEESLRQLLKRFGELESLRVVQERYFAFALFADRGGAAMCVEHLHGFRAEGAVKPLHVTYAMHSEAAEAEPNPRVFVRGLPAMVSQAQLVELFQPFGTVSDSSLIVFADGRCKGTGFVTMASVSEATASIAGLDGKEAALAPQVPQGPVVAARLVVRYSETPAAKAARQRENRERVAERAAEGQSSRSSAGRRSGRGTADGGSSTTRSTLQYVPSPGPLPGLLFGQSAVTGSNRRTSTSSERVPLPGSAGAASSLASRSFPTLISTAGSSATAPPSSVSPLLLRAPTPAFPATGDVFVGPAHAMSSPEAIVSLITNVSAPPSLVCPFNPNPDAPGDSGFAVRLRDASHVDSVVAALHGASLMGTGECLTSWRFT